MGMILSDTGNDLNRQNSNASNIDIHTVGKRKRDIRTHTF